MKKVLFLHGLESKPGGSKAKFLAKNGYEVLNPMLPKSSFEDSVRIAQKIVDEDRPDVIVGSSRGGAIAMCLEPYAAGVVLVAPAWSHFDYSRENALPTSKGTVILHCKDDDIVKFEDSKRLCDEHGAQLISVGKEHRMSDSDALDAILDAVQWVTKDKE